MTQPQPPLYLPVVSPFVERRVGEWLRDRNPSQKPPHAAARLLSFIVFMKEDNRPFPIRDVVASHLDISVPSVDAIISRCRRRGMVVIEYEYPPGRIKQYDNSVKIRYVVPSPELFAVVADREEGRIESTAA